MKTTWNSSPIIQSWYMSILKITCAIHPHLFTWTHKGIRCPAHASHSTHFCKQDIPIPAPDYNLSATSIPFHQSKDMLALLSVLHNEFSKGMATITSDDFMVVLDSGCRYMISFDKNDFVSCIRPVQFVEFKGIASGLCIQGIGQLQWTFLNEQGEWVCIQITCLYVPNASTRLLLLQQLSNQCGTSTSNGTWIGHGQDALVFYQGQGICFP